MGVGVCAWVDGSKVNTLVNDNHIHLSGLSVISIWQGGSLSAVLFYAFLMQYRCKTGKY
jgi:hypothetical protein